MEKRKKISEKSKYEIFLARSVIINKRERLLSKKKLDSNREKNERKNYQRLSCKQKCTIIH